MSDDLKNQWTDLPEFASDKVGGKIIFCTDEFFAAAERMIKFNEPESKHILTSWVWMDGGNQDANALKVMTGVF